MRSRAASGPDRRQERASSDGAVPEAGDGGGCRGDDKRARPGGTERTEAGRSRPSTPTISTGAPPSPATGGTTTILTPRAAPSLDSRPLGRYDPKIEAKLSSPPPSESREGTGDAPPPSLPSIVRGRAVEAHRVTARNGVVGPRYRLLRTPGEDVPHLQVPQGGLPGARGLHVPPPWPGGDALKVGGRRGKNPSVANVSGAGATWSVSCRTCPSGIW